MDAQNEPFPVPVARQVGNYQVQEIQALDYPMFIDVRSDGMAEDNPIVSGLPAVTLQWASPITVDPEKNATRDVEALLTSSTQSWTQSDFNIQPNFDLYPEMGFAVISSMQPYTLAVSARGSFESYFKGKPSPSDAAAAEAAATASATAEAGDEAAAPQTPATVGTIEVSPDTARLIVIGSVEFVDDIVLELSSTLSGERYLNNLQFLQNAVAWTIEDLDLLSIRSRGTAARVLIDMEENEQSFWEAANYVLALISVVAIAGVTGMRRRSEVPMALVPPDEVAYAPARRRKPGLARDTGGDAPADLSEEVNQ